MAPFSSSTLINYPCEDPNHLGTNDFNLYVLFWATLYTPTVVFHSLRGRLLSVKSSSGMHGNHSPDSIALKAVLDTTEATGHAVA
jgi:hypothetical protein